MRVWNLGMESLVPYPEVFCMSSSYTLSESQPEIDASPFSDRPPARLLACGTPEDVERMITWLQLKGFAQVGEWSPPLPSAHDGQIVRILTRYYGGIQNH